jgi:hypothetical protein
VTSLTFDVTFPGFSDGGGPRGTCHDNSPKMRSLDEMAQIRPTTIKTSHRSKLSVRYIATKPNLEKYCKLFTLSVHPILTRNSCIVGCQPFKQIFLLAISFFQFVIKCPCFSFCTLSLYIQGITIRQKRSSHRRLVCIGQLFISCSSTNGAAIVYLLFNHL